MSHLMQVVIPEPKYHVGATLIALVNHQPRYVEVLQAHLSANFILESDGVSMIDGATWEYDVLVQADPIEFSERMIITERSIIVDVSD